MLLLERNLWKNVKIVSKKHLLHFMISSCTSWFYISQLEIDQGPGRFQPPCMTAMELAENAVVGSEPTYSLRILTIQWSYGQFVGCMKPIFTKKHNIGIVLRFKGGLFDVILWQLIFLEGCRISAFLMPMNWNLFTSFKNCNIHISIFMEILLKMQVARVFFTTWSHQNYDQKPLLSWEFKGPPTMPPPPKK